MFDRVYWFIWFLFEMLYFVFIMCCFFEQKTAYEVRISDWSSDVCSSDLRSAARGSALAGCVLAGCALAAGRAVFWSVCGRAVCGLRAIGKIGRASCRERVCQYV